MYVCYSGSSFVVNGAAKMYRNVRRIVEWAILFRCCGYCFKKMCVFGTV
jgi:hypothetical protein